MRVPSSLPRQQRAADTSLGSEAGRSPPPPSSSASHGLTDLWGVRLLFPVFYARFGTCTIFFTQVDIVGLRVGDESRAIQEASTFSWHWV